MDSLISRQAAIDALEGEIEVVGKANAEAVLKYTKTVCNRIKALPSAHQDFDEWCTDCKEYDQKKHCCPRFNRVIRNALKDAQPERKKGKWIVYYECPKCGEITKDFAEYCPFCGADMREEIEDADNS